MQGTTTAMEREVYRDYDKDRRLRVTRQFSATFFVLLTLALISTLFTLGTRPAFNDIMASLGPSSLAVAGYGVAWWLTLRRHDIGAASLFVVSTIFVVAEFQIAYAVRDGIGPLTLAIMAAYANNIAFCGLIGNTWLLVAVTIFENGLTAFLLVLLPNLIGQPHIPQLPIILATYLYVQWAACLSFYFGYRQNLRTLRELGDVRIAYTRSRQVEAIKDQFITSVNHELRTPMMTVIGWLEVLQTTARDIQKTSNEVAIRDNAQGMLDDFARAEAAGQGLTELINSILDVNRLDGDLLHFAPQPVNVRMTLNAAIDLLDQQGSPRDLMLTVPTDLIIFGEPIWLQQILTNLLSNAMKYSPPGSPIEVIAESVVVNQSKGRLAPMVQIAVHDQGLGIPPEQIPLLFGKFVRLPRDLASTVIGNGLGLYLCRTYSEAMGGRVWVESTGIEGEGSTFFVRLPATADDAARIPTPAAPEPLTVG